MDDRDGWQEKVREIRAGVRHDDDDDDDRKIHGNESAINPKEKYESARVVFLYRPSRSTTYA